MFSNRLYRSNYVSTLWLCHKMNCPSDWKYKYLEGLAKYKKYSRFGKQLISRLVALFLFKIRVKISHQIRTKETFGGRWDFPDWIASKLKIRTESIINLYLWMFAFVDATAATFHPNFFIFLLYDDDTWPFPGLDCLISKNKCWIHFPRFGMWVVILNKFWYLRTTWNGYVQCKHIFQCWLT